ncbi:MAG: undecaprenyl/decaprenyl-phosphate alpha-N-acetylglucosaminyl 1-phosphate transferase [Candidatus Kerfeldbacteria bacterium]|nr:undecaprenyl/decaprenyl-phosphate alpha-N-acetylglucosaminyl 1-phosphate transferase [Candidatus Kerfeldbacteria bacterium]
MNAAAGFLLAFIITTALAWFVAKLAGRWRVVDQPLAAPDRKVHSFPVPLLGGIAIFVGFFGVVAYYSQSAGVVTGLHILPKHLWGMFIGALLIMLGGYLDDRYNLPPSRQIIFPIMAAAVLVLSGVGIRQLSNPFGGTLVLDQINLPLVKWHGVVYQLTLWADLLTFVWILGMMYTTKFLDGLDGLVSGITAIGSITIFVLSLRPPVLQSETAQLAIILAGACAGFLVWNWHPARVFLGEGGSLLTGFLLGTLAIVAGSKIATALLIMGIPILDVVWVIVRRTLIEHRSPFRTADRKHLHFRLLDVGFSHRGAVVFLYLLTLAGSATTLFFQGQQKVMALAGLALVMLVGGAILVLAVRRRRPGWSGGQ